MEGAHAHSHSHEVGKMPPAPRRVRHVIAAIILPLVAATIVGLIVLWPRGDVPFKPSAGAVNQRGTVVSATPACPVGTAPMPGGACGNARVRLGNDIVDATVPSGATAPAIQAGDRVGVAS